jgi:hypothetical protein
MMQATCVPRSAAVMDVVLARSGMVGGAL